MTTHPFIPFYVDDYEAATTHLTVEEDGAYNRLLRLCWRTPGCSLPDDDAWIARKIRLSSEDFQRIAKPVLSEFFAFHRGRLIQRRLKAEYDDISRKKTARKNAGKKGGEAKARKTKDNSPSNASDLPPDTRAFQNHNQNHNQIIELETLRVSNPINRAGAFERFWSAYPSKVGKRAAEAAFAKALKRTDPETIIGAVQAAQGCDQWRRGFIPNPTTWLNQDRWTDEHAPPPVSDQLVRRHENYRRAFAGAAAAFDPPDFDR